MLTDMAEQKKRIALVEDNDVIRENYGDFLRDNGYEVHEFDSKAAALAGVHNASPDLVLLDLALHEDREAGFEICMELRRLAPALPIVFLTSQDNDFDRISGLRVGADDYITKDCELKFLIVRIEALLRRIAAISAAHAHHQTELRDVASPQDLALDENKSTAMWKGKLVSLPLTQFWMLQDLYSHKGDVRSHRDLMRKASITVEPNTITAHVKSIRDSFQKIDPDFQSIRTERGRGYRWVD